MSKLNLSEAAAKILEGDAASNLNASKAKAPSAPFGDGYKPNVTAPQQSKKDIGKNGYSTDDSALDPTDGVPTATAPGKTPPVGSEPMKKLATQPGDNQGRSDLAKSPEVEPETSSAAEKGERTKATLASVKKQGNPKAVTACEGEDEEEFEDEELEEATVEEVMEDLENMDDETFMEKYGCDKEFAVEAMSCDSEEDDSDEDDSEEEEKAEKKAEMKKKVKEDVDAMLSGENLSEEFKEKASMIFEAAVEARVEEIAAELEEKYVAEFEQTLEVVKEDFASKLDSYLDYVVENWMAENELAIEKGLRSEIVEDFIGALKNVFVEHYIDIPEDKVDIVEQLADRVEELEDQINEQHLKNIELKKSLSEHKKEEAVHLACEGLTLSQAEKVRALAKNVEFVSEEDFSEKLVAIKESYFPTEIKAASADSLNDMIELDEDNTTKVVDPLIESYVNKITRLAKF